MGKNVTTHSCRDIAHTKHQRVNPYKRGEKNSGIKRKILLLLLGTAVLGVIFLLIYHPFFHIQKIHISGIERINSKAIHNAVSGIVDYRRFFILPGKSYFGVNTKEIENIVQEKFPVTSMHIKKTFPQTLLIEIKEKISTLIYDNEETFSYIGLDGKILETIRNVGEDEWDVVLEYTTSTNELGEEIKEERVVKKNHIIPFEQIASEMGNHPIVYDKRKRDSLKNEVVHPESVAKMVKWYNLLKEQAKIPLAYITLEKEPKHVQLHTTHGWFIYTRLTYDVEKQFAILQQLIKEEVPVPNIMYIDMRYGDKIYWK
ncbi:MAG: hypothetical protein CL685_02895 [Candidatus Magasanikbacteria bacterium]|nr:hypothetical protein [Candidatus Magasanikbacteria bacterium]|tara:strand:- start:2629 stop:3573 length:945 start_codon:yes stop_codon:yes gene_type:complete